MYNICMKSTELVTLNRDPLCLLEQLTRIVRVYEPMTSRRLAGGFSQAEQMWCDVER
jgi:hypothetical protein